MGSGASAKRMPGGKLPLKYFHEDIWPTVEELFEKLCMDETLSSKIFLSFIEIDSDETSTADIKELFDYFGATRTKLTERVFYYVEPNSGVQGFKFQDFAVTIWNFCSFNNAMLARYLFEVYDIDCEGFVEKNDVESMYKMAYDCDDHDDEFIGEAPYEDNVIKKEDFISYFSKKTGRGDLIEPLIKFQNRLRKKCGGVFSWESISRLRVQHFDAYDTMSKTQAEALVGILASEDINRRKRKEEADRILEMEKRRLQQEAERAERELAEREAQLERERLAREANAPDRFMKQALRKLEHARHDFDHTDFFIDDIWLRRERREEIYKLYDSYAEIARKFYAESEKKTLEITVGTREDHMARLKDYLATDSGRLHFRRVLLNMIFKDQTEKVEEKRRAKAGKRKKDTRTEKEMMIETANNDIIEHMRALDEYNAYLEEIKGLSKDAAFEIEVKRPVKLKEFEAEYDLAKSLISKSELAAYEKKVEEFLYEKNRNEVIHECEKALAIEKAERERELVRQEFDIVTNYGSRITRWEYVRDKENARDCYINVDTLEYMHAKTAICEKCDAIFEQSELKCEGCAAPRSTKNMTLYRPLGFKDIRVD